MVSFWVSAVGFLACAQSVLAGYSSSSVSNVAVYWGQNSKGTSTSQQRLSYYCSTSNLDIIPLAFVVKITGSGGKPEVNFASAGAQCTVFSGTNLWNCPQIAADIVTCQKTYGKTILLSIGGATYNQGGFGTAAAATSAATLIWQTFGPVQSGVNTPRPFGNSAVDGFDLDIESSSKNMIYFANKLRSFMDADKSKTGKNWMLTAAPQCPYPDANMNDMLKGQVYFDAIFVQFYNNYCGTQSYVSGTTNQPNFNFKTWDDWSRNTSRNKNVKVFLGIPGATGAAGSGYVDSTKLKSIITYCKTFKSFGGVAIWDASQVWPNTNYLSSAKSALTTKRKRFMSREFIE